MLGNFVGALLTAMIMMGTQQYMFSKGLVGLTALNTAMTKVSYNPVQAFFLGVMCNALVCMAVWLCYSARSTLDKIASIIFPITAFVAAGFEHSIANMYFIPMGLFIKQFAPPCVLGVGRAGQRHTDPDHGGELRQLDLAQLLRQEPDPGHGGQCHRRRGVGRPGLLVRLSARQEGLIYRRKLCEHTCWSMFGPVRRSI